MKKTVLGVKIDDVSRQEAVIIITSWLSSRAKRGDLSEKKIASSQAPRNDMGDKLVFTTGPEFLVTAQEDLEFKKILNSADLNIPDGIGLKLFCGFKNSFAGVDLMLDLCELASEKNLTVGLFGGQEDVAKKTAQALVKRFKGLKVKFAIDGEEADRLIDSGLRRNDMVDFLFVGLGHPKQEKFLSRTYNLEPRTFKVGMGVGGSFDFISGNLPRPPELLRKFGLGWLYRGFTKPGHWKRIFKALIVFPWLVFKNSI